MGSHFRTSFLEMDDPVVGVNIRLGSAPDDGELSRCDEGLHDLGHRSCDYPLTA